MVCGPGTTWDNERYSLFEPQTTQGSRDRCSIPGSEAPDPRLPPLLLLGLCPCSPAPRRNPRTVERERHNRPAQSSPKGPKRSPRFRSRCSSMRAMDWTEGCGQWQNPREHRTSRRTELGPQGCRANPPPRRPLYKQPVFPSLFPQLTNLNQPTMKLSLLTVAAVASFVAAQE